MKKLNYYKENLKLQLINLRKKLLLLSSGRDNNKIDQIYFDPASLVVNDYIHLGQYAFIEVPDISRAISFVRQPGIHIHNWDEKNIQYNFMRYSDRNQFIIGFYIAAGLGYHIYNISLDAIEAECLGVERFDGEFWKENIAGKKFSLEKYIKPNIEYVVVKILLTE